MNISWLLVGNCVVITGMILVAVSYVLVIAGVRQDKLRREAYEREFGIKKENKVE